MTVTRNKLTVEQRNHLICWMGANREALSGLTLHEGIREAKKAGYAVMHRDSFRKTLRSLGIEPKPLRVNGVRKDGYPSVAECRAAAQEIEGLKAKVATLEEVADRHRDSIKDLCARLGELEKPAPAVPTIQGPPSSLRISLNGH
jgi:uncharacterized coiled-coil protein SlyX